MQAKLTYTGKVEPSDLKITNRKGFDRDIQDYFNGKEVVITIEKKKSKRSDPQNRYFHGVIIPIVKSALLDLGFEEAKSSEWVKDFIKFNCLIKEYISAEGEVIKSLGKTSQLTKSEFADMVADVQRWAADKLNIYIPDPGEQTVLFTAA